MDYREPIRQYMQTTFLFDPKTKLEDSTSFLKDGIIDSTGILELITYLEETYQIKIEDEELVPENFDSLQRIDQYLQKKLNGALVTSEAA
ncbi:acyl carrier protein [candidate division KSB1 bacterium]|nr:acyl carrier protein [candidate division KSB1 bacterium]